jgi:histidinol dehydrogenase
VDKIFGPGNQYVTMAKQIVSRQGVAIDMPAGPSEVLVMADESANPSFVAADLISQAEHGADSQVIVLSINQDFLNMVKKELDLIIKDLPRGDMASKALENSIGIVLADTDEMMEFSNAYAPEHLIISVKKASEMAEEVLNAGSVFLGNYSPESAGDYASGTNHTLPTNGFARSYSGLTTQSFMKTIQFQRLNIEGIRGIGPQIMDMAKAEGLEGHSLAVELRLKELNNEKD